MKCSTFILKCFLQFTCTNLNDCQKEGVTFFNLPHKEVGSFRKGGEVSNPRRSYVSVINERPKQTLSLRKQSHVTAISCSHNLRIGS